MKTIFLTLALLKISPISCVFARESNGHDSTLHAIVPNCFKMSGFVNGGSKERKES